MEEKEIALGLSKPKKAKTCELVNDKYIRWQMYVDNQHITFFNTCNAKYFYNHYKKLGYELIVDAHDLKEIKSY